MVKKFSCRCCHCTLYKVKDIGLLVIYLFYTKKQHFLQCYSFAGVLFCINNTIYVIIDFHRWNVSRTCLKTSCSRYCFFLVITKQKLYNHIRLYYHYRGIDKHQSRSLVEDFSSYGTFLSPVVSWPPDNN